MTTQELLDYIKQKKEEGISREEIKKSLQDSGWEEGDIEEGFSSIENSFRGEDIHYSPQETPKKPKLLIVSAVLGLLIMAGGVFGYFYYYAKSPEEVVKKMIEKTTQLKSFQYEGEIAIEEDKEEALISFNGASDFHDSENPKVKFGLDFEADTLPQSVGAEARMIKDVFYFKINNIPPLGFFDLSSLEGQWIKADKKTVMPEEESENFAPEEILGEEFRKEQAEKMNEIFIFERKLPGEKINGVSVYHYEFSLKEEKLIDLVVDMNKESGMPPPSEEELKEMREAFQKMESKGELWIGKKDFLLYKLTFSLDIQDEKSQGKVSFVSRIKNHNEPVQIEVPSPVKTFEEIFGGFGQSFGRGSSASDAKIMAGITQISPMAEIVRANSVNNSYDGLCASVVRLGETEWLEGIEEDIIDNGGSIACYAKGDAYCVSSRLSSGEHYCILHTGNKGKGESGCTGVSTGCGLLVK